jgi:ABC-type antimicrobial peptide transport system permease subunit
MAERISELADRPRFNAVLLTFFAGVGVMLAAIGLYGMISYLVTQRTQEIGVRIALGATPIRIVKLVFSSVLPWTIAGLLAGLVGSFFATRLLRSLLYQVPERDVWTFSIAIAVILASAVCAMWLPSRRALRTDPIAALKQE